MHRRTKRRLIVLAAVLATVGIVGVGGYTLQQAQRARISERALEEGMAAYEQADYQQALQKLGTHLRYQRDNTEALIAYADCRRRVSSPNGQHLTQAVGLAQQALQQDPGNARTQRMLMELYAELGYLTELAETSAAILQADPADAEAAALRVQALLASGNEPDAVAAAQDFVRATDGDIDAHQLLLSAMQGAGRPARELRQHLQEAVAPDHAGTPRFAILAASVELQDERLDRAADILERAIDTARPDQPGAPGLLGAMEQVAAAANRPELYERSERLLEAWTASDTPSPELAAIAAGRAWRLGQPARAVELASRARELAADPQAQDQSETETATPTPSAEALGWGVLGAADLAQNGAQARTDLLASLNNLDDQAALRWARVAEAYDHLRAGRVAAARQALPDRANLTGATGLDGAALFVLASADLADGNPARAIDGLVPLARQPSWRRAKLLIARALLADNRPREALSVFTTDPALVELPDGPELFGDAWAGAIEASDDPGAIDTTVIADALAANPDNPVLLAAIGRAALAAGDVDRAREMARRLLEADAAQAAIAVMRFARRLRAADEDLADRLAGSVAGTATTPTQVLAVATDLALRGLGERAMTTIDLAAQADTQAARIQWDLARLDVAGLVGGEPALGLMAELSKRYEDDERVQARILETQAAWTNLDLVAVVVGRLQEIQGEEATEWRIYEARRRLEANRGEAAAESAALLLGDVVRSAEGQRSTTAMLTAAEAFRRLNDTTSELEVLEFAVQGDDPARAMPVLIDRLQTLGRSDQARRRLVQFLGFTDIPPQIRRQRATLLQRQGMPAQAAEDIATLARVGGPEDVLSAALLRRRQDPQLPLNEAERKALQADLSPSGLVSAARLLSLLGRVDEGLELLARLPQRSPVGSRPIITARYLHDAARTDGAVALLTEYAGSGGGAQAWIEAARLLVSAGREADARDLLARAAEALPQDASIGAFAQALDTGERMPLVRRLALFASTTEGLGAAPDELAGLGELSGRYVRGELDTAAYAAALEELLDRRAGLYSAWRLLLAARLELGQPERAVAAARAAVEALPADARPARDASLLMLDLNRHADAAAMAATWRQRAPDADARAAADLVAGVAEYRRGQPQRALALLEPHADRVLASPAANEPALLALTASLARVGDIDRAARMLWDLHAQDPAWGYTIATVAAAVAQAEPPSPQRLAVAADWLDRLGSQLTADAAGAASLASAWLALAGAMEGDTANQRVVAIADRAAGGQAETWQLRAMQAQALSALGEHARAVESYQEAIGLAPEPQTDLLNNAAYLLTTRLGEHARAVELATRAVTIAADDRWPAQRRAAYLDTLATALLANQQPQRALDTIERGIQLTPDNTGLLLARARALLDLGRQADARAALLRAGDPDRMQGDDRDTYNALAAELQ